MSLKDKSLKTSLSLLPVIAIIIGGALSYTIQGIISALTQTQIGFTWISSIDTALIVGPIMGTLAGLSYSTIGFLPAALLLNKSKRFQKADKDGYFKNIISGEIIIITALIILITIDVLWYIFHPTTPYLKIHFTNLPKGICKTLLVFGGFPLIGTVVIMVIKGLRKLFKLKILTA